MKFISKNSSLQLYLLLILILGILTPYISYANRADYTPDEIDIVCDRRCQERDSTLTIAGIRGSLTTSNVKTRGFEMRRSDDASTLSRTGSSVPIGTTLRYENKGSGYDAEGSWFFSGGYHDSPDMNNQWIGLKKNNRPLKVDSRFVAIKVKPPINQNPNRFRTTGPVTCNESGVCTVSSTQVGEATITIRFPGTTAEVVGGLGDIRNNQFEREIRTDTAYLNFRSVEYTYTFSVYNPNSAPTVSCIAPYNISYTTAEARWSYSDADGDGQTNANIQVATDSNFNNIVADVNSNGNGTTRTITGLSHSTTYYTRVRVKNAVNTDWTGFSTCPGSFTTLINNPATVNLTSVAPAASDPDKYTRAVINWTYTDPENDPQTRAEIAISTDPTFPNNANTIRYVSSGAGTSYTTALASLLPGETYYVTVRAENEPNGWSEWSNSRSVTMPNYPVPQVTYSISKTGDASTAKTNGQTLVLKTGDKVNANWSIDNGTEVGLESCALSTTGGGNLASSITGQPGETDFKNSLSFTGPGDGLPSRNINGVQVPTITADRTYDVTLNCTGKPAKTVRSVNQAINLTVESYPIITSCSVDGNSTVQAGQTNVNIEATVGNVSSYEFKIGRKNGDNDPLTDNTSTPNLNRTLSYAGIEFGRHTPWLEVTRLPITNPERTVRDTCGTVANLGDSNIKEVR